MNVSLKPWIQMRWFQKEMKEDMARYNCCEENIFKWCLEVQENWPRSLDKLWRFWDLEIFLSVLKICLTLTKHNFLNFNPNETNFISLESLEQEEQLSCWRNFQMELLFWCKMGLKWMQQSWKLALNGKSTISKFNNFLIPD